MTMKEKTKKRTRNAFLLLTAVFGAVLFLNRERLFSAGCIGEHHRISVNGVTIYYETAGDGEPVILLHGNGGSHKDLHEEIRQLTEAGYRVYAPDSRGQGHSSSAEEYHYTDMADDVFYLIQEWKLDKPSLYGWSDGGIIGLLTEIRHPGTLGALAVSGANVSPDGLEDSFLDPIRFLSPVAGSLTQMILNEPDISEEELASIQIPVLVTAGSDDIVKREHTEMIARSIPDAELMIFEGESHGSYITGSTKMGELLLSFLKSTTKASGE